MTTNGEHIVGLVKEIMDGVPFDELALAEARHILFDDCARASPAHAATVLSAMRLERAAAVVEAMSLGVDAPPEMARVWPHIPGEALGALLARVHPASLARLAREMESDDQARLLAVAGRGTTAALLARIAEDDGRVAKARAARMLSRLPWQDQTTILGRLSPVMRARLTPALRHSNGGPLSGLNRRQARLYLIEASLEEAVFALIRSSPDTAADALATLDAPRAAAALAAIAASEPTLAADLLRGLDTDTLLGFRAAGGERTPCWEPCARVSASVVAEFDLQAPPALSLLRLLPDATLGAILDRLSPLRREEILGALERDDLLQGVKRDRM
ncbi:MAG: hypothetical protein U9R15_17475 [Chloroflexota bacterium]|nr:hypothetical protein [Chloroflexota bacterium]